MYSAVIFKHSDFQRNIIYEESITEAQEGDEVNLQFQAQELEKSWVSDPSQAVLINWLYITYVSLQFNTNGFRKFGGSQFSTLAPNIVQCSSSIL